MNDTIYKKTLQLGKIDYCDKGRAVNAVSIDVELRQRGGEKTFTIDKATKERVYTGGETERYIELSICGNIWNGGHSDILCGGQCIDTIAEYIHTPQMQEILEIWKRWHLNGMRAACEHQRALGWEEMVDEDITLYHYELTQETRDAVKKIKKDAIDTITRGETFTPDHEQVFMLGLQDSLVLPDDNIPTGLMSFYRPRKKWDWNTGATQTKKRGCTRPEEHPDGLLCKPCPVCGYKYGSSWLHETLPDEVIETVKGW